MSARAVRFLFVHGAWHNRACWQRLLPLIEAAGHQAQTLDLPGAGVNAAIPEFFSHRPIDRSLYGSVPSPNAGVTQEERTKAVIDAIDQSGDGGRVILVGHSLGGLTISAVAEAAPDKIAALVYLTAFLLPQGLAAIEMIHHPTMADAVTPSLFLGDPAVLGALRLDPWSEDAEYQTRLTECFYGDVDREDLDFIKGQLHPDEPAAVTLTPSAITPSRHGRLARHYIRCSEDRAIPLAGQEHMIKEADKALGGATQTHLLAASHSPFLSQPTALASLLHRIALQRNGE